MPTYSFEKNGEEKSLFCKYEELEQVIEEMAKEGWTRVFNINLVSGQGSALSKTDSGWKDVLKQIKKGSGKSNTINV